MNGRRLTADEIRELHEAAVELHLDRVALLAGVHASFVANIETSRTHAAQLLTDLHTLNDATPLLDGSLPLRVWLSNARTLATSRAESLIFDRYLSLFPKADGASPDTSSSSGPVQPNNSVADSVSPVNIYRGEDIKCMTCGKDLLNPPSGNIVFLERDLKSSAAQYVSEIVDVYWACKGRCDRALLAMRDSPEVVDSWKDIPDIVMPIGFAQAIMATMNRLHGGEKYTDNAFEKYRRFLAEVFRYVAREPTASEKERAQLLSALPSWLGGIGDE